ncbi:MAG TPA: YeaH/YhbH family protein [Gammaproteobacteria bacterium]|nr:YeaH/YhbH family protein [Gammaproteobacteria bacterium]
MSRLVDRRLNGKNKSAVNRQRFIRRYKDKIKKSVSDAISGRSVTDIENGEKVSIPAKDISEPVIYHGPGGHRENVHPGNREFVQGDKIARPKSAGAGGRGDKASNDGEGTDDFVFELSKEEFMEFFFEDLALPNLVKTKLSTIHEKAKSRAGFTNAGVPTNINILRSMQSAQARRVALRNPYKRKLKEKEAELAVLLKTNSDDSPEVVQLIKEIEGLKRKRDAVPFIDTFDLRYNNHIEVPKPITQAVMFCVMDVSGSMDRNKKDIAKRFFILLYLFLTRNYEKIEIVFISHHTTAKEVSEEAFFYSRETGGTVVSSALELMSKIARERYATDDWNIYAAQASDGDNWLDDSPLCRNLLEDEIMPFVQYYFYVEITAKNHQSLWHEYEKIAETFPNFAMQQLHSASDIYPVFRELFSKETGT